MPLITTFFIREVSIAFKNELQKYYFSQNIVFPWQKQNFPKLLYLLATCCPSTPEPFSPTPIEYGSFKLPFKIIKVVLCYWILLFFTVHNHHLKWCTEREGVNSCNFMFSGKERSPLPKSKHLIEEWGGSGGSFPWRSTKEASKLWIPAFFYSALWSLQRNTLSSAFSPFLHKAASHWLF